MGLAEFLQGRIDMRHWMDSCRKIKTALILDYRGGFDALSKSESLALGMADKRSAIDALALKRALVETGRHLRWCHSEAQLADMLTKDSEKAREPWRLLCKRGGTWRLIYDPDYVSARKRKAQGLSPPERNKNAQGTVAGVDPGDFCGVGDNGLDPGGIEAEDAANEHLRTLAGVRATHREPREPRALQL